MKVALYGRVSTAEQNAAMQLEELRSYCGRRQWTIIEEFIDAGVSGSKESRPALNRLLADAKRRKFDAVLVYRYDRFARSLRQLVNALAEFDALGIHFVSLHEGVDTSTPNGRLVFGIFASIAEFERELIRGRVRSGLAAARARGKRLGRPRVIVDAATIAVLRSEGLSWAKIGERLGWERVPSTELFRHPPKTCSKKHPQPPLKPFQISNRRKAIFAARIINY
jgi:DNA invertase Pin-like site-specific DNA recombinase